MAYDKQTWQTGDVVTAEKMNNIEQGIENSADGSIYQNDRIEMDGNIGTAGENSIILPKTVSGHATNANGNASIHIGAGYSSNDNNIHIGVVVTPSANEKSRYPHLLDYLESDGKMVTYTKAQGCLNIGANHVEFTNNATALAVGYENVVKRPYGTAIGGNNLVQGIYSCLFGYGLKGYDTTAKPAQCMVGYIADAELDDVFVVGNGSSSGETRLPSTAFSVKDDGTAVAKTALGIKKSDGTVVTITAEQLEALLALLE